LALRRIRAMEVRSAHRTGGTYMRKSLSIVLMPAALLVAAAALAPRPAAAAFNYPWCATFYDSSLGMKSCSFSSYGQCMATISGVGGICAQNPLYASPPPYAEPRRAKKSHLADH
jgi:hypothetical protein